jgi:hypothetical protein
MRYAAGVIPMLAAHMLPDLEMGSIAPVSDL